MLIWLMIVPMLLKVEFGALHRGAEQWRGIAVTVAINWLVKPFSARPSRRNVPTRNVGGGRARPARGGKVSE